MYVSGKRASCWMRISHPAKIASRVSGSAEEVEEEEEEEERMAGLHMWSANLMIQTSLPQSGNHNP